MSISGNYSKIKVSNSSVISFFHRDVEGHYGLYECIAVIQFDGRLNLEGQSGGHYTCDIKEKVSNMWFKTNDEQDPVPIEVEDVSKYAYVVLLKRKI